MVKYERRRITTEDEDFLDLDCLLTGNSRLAILCHGLGGSSEAPYMKSTAEEFQRRDFDVVAMNYRSCSEEVNRKAKMYGMMTYLDLETVVKAFEEEYSEIVLVGFSMGGNIVLNFMVHLLPKYELIKGAVSVSAPCDVWASISDFEKLGNGEYQEYFLDKIKDCLREKNQKYPNIFEEAGVCLEEALRSKGLRAFDETFTIKVEGFSNIDEYYKTTTTKGRLHLITRPTLLLLPWDDIVVSSNCFPTEEGRRNSNLFFERPEFGGHLGYESKNQRFGLEERIVDFMLEEAVE